MRILPLGVGDAALGREGVLVAEGVYRRRAKRRLGQDSGWWVGVQGKDWRRSTRQRIPFAEVVEGGVDEPRDAFVYSDGEKASNRFNRMLSKGKGPVVVLPGEGAFRLASGAAVETPRVTT